MEYDEILKTVGEFGPYQRKVLLILCFLVFPTAIQNLGYIFWAYRPDYVCDVTRPDILANVSQALWRNLTLPFEKTADDTWAHSQCERYDVNLTSINNANDVLFLVRERQVRDDADDASTLPCDSWAYDTSQFKSTIVSEFNLVCNRKWLRSSTQSVYMFGKFVGCIVFGALADRFGRRTVLLWTVVVQALFGCAIAFAPEIYTFLLLRFCLAVVITGVFQVAYVLVLEFVGPSAREIASYMFMVTWAVAYMALCGVAYAIRERFYLQLATSVPLLLLIAFFWVTPESPRWLLLKGKKESAMKIIEKISSDQKCIRLLEKQSVCLKREPENRMSWRQALRKPFLWIMSAVLWLIWFSVNLVYYGLSLSSSNFVGNIFLNNFIFGAVEIPAYVIGFLIQKYLGRKWPLVMLLLLTGGCLLLACQLPPSMGQTVTLLAMFGKCAITCTFGMIYLYTSELYATSMRSFGLGGCSAMARFSGIFAPFAAELDTVKPGLSLIVFSSMSILAGVCAVILPETKGKSLPQSLEDGSQLAKSATVIRCLVRSDDLSSTESSDATDVTSPRTELMNNSTKL